jgi:hypothetical protein
MDERTELLDELAELRQRLEDQHLPVEHLDDALPHLRRPFAAAAVKWKVQSSWPKASEQQAPTGCIVVAYIDARLVVERLNTVVGGRWSQEYRPTSKDDLLMCDLTVCGVKRPDVGQSPKKLSKDLVSDALKRAAVTFGVGVSIYALPQVRLTMGDNPRHLEVRGRGDRRTLVLTDFGHKALRLGYERWLREIGVGSFGPVLDHGDALGIFENEAPGEEEEPDAAAETAVEAPEPLTDDVATQLRAQIEEAYTALRAVSKRALLPAAFQAELLGAQASHEKLRELLTRLQDLREDARPKSAVAA